MKSQAIILLLISLIHVFGSDEETKYEGSKQKFFKHQNAFNDLKKVEEFLAFKELFNENSQESDFGMKHNVSEKKQKDSADELTETLPTENSQNGKVETQGAENIGEWKTTFSETVKSWRAESDTSQKFEEGKFAVSETARPEKNNKMKVIESYETPERLFTSNPDDSHTQIKIRKVKNEMYERNSFPKTSQEYSLAELNDENEKETFDIPNAYFPRNQQNFKKEMQETICLYDNSMNMEFRAKNARCINRYECRLCEGYICLGQPFIGITNKHRGHAICLAGYGGERCEFYRKNETRTKTNLFGKCLLDIFKEHYWLNTYSHMNLIWEELEKRYKERKMKSPCRNEHNFVCQMRLLNFDIAYWHEEFKGKTVHWYIHRKNWQQPEYVNWQEYIEEILKAKHTIPVVNFSYNSNGLKPIIPHKLLDFIKQHTKCASFEQAVEKHMPNVEIYHQYNDMDGMFLKLMRLKNESKCDISSRQEISRLLKEKEIENIQTAECNLEFNEQRTHETCDIDDCGSLFELNVFRDSKKSSPIKNPSKV